tara:strand:+ start:196 stop:588 length:393 start_codon:yes stop_codon:yes gene_type:complete
MATQIVIANKESIKVDDDFHISWADKGKNWDDNWLPDTIHFVIWNNLVGQNEIQNKDASTGMMTGNVALNATSDTVGNTTIADLLVWAETRQLQIEEAQNDYLVQVDLDEKNGTTVADNQTWRDYDSNYS